MKKSALILSVLFLASCGKKVVVPEAIEKYLNQCSIDKAVEETKFVSSTFSSVKTSLEDNKELNRYTYSFKADFSTDFHLVSTYTYLGDKIALNQKVSLYVTKSVSEIYLEESTSQYVQIETYYGYKNSDLSGEEKEAKVNPVHLSKDQVSSRKDGLFYSNKTGNYYLGGLYYADMFKLRAETLYPAYTLLENGNFLYYVHDIKIDDKSGQGMMNTEITMLRNGMLSNLVEDATNNNLKQKVLTTQTVSYEPEEK